MFASKPIATHFDILSSRVLVGVGKAQYKLDNGVSDFWVVPRLGITTHAVHKVDVMMVKV